MTSERPDAFKNDFPNALKRNLHNWAQWRVDVNDQLVTSLMTGQRSVDVEPLGKYLHNSQHPTENPSTLLSYSASSDNISSLGMRRFLHYGIPRAKVNQGGRRANDTTSQMSQTPSTYTIHEHPDERHGYVDENRPHVEPPYHPPEPDPDYERRAGQMNLSDADDITAPGSSASSTTDSSDTETLYVPRRSPLSRKSSTEFTNSSGKRQLSRTYSTLNALDPIYMTQKSRATLNSKLSSSKPPAAAKPPTNNRTPLSNIYSPTPTAQMTQQRAPPATLPKPQLQNPPSSYHPMAAPTVKPIPFYPAADVMPVPQRTPEYVMSRQTDYDSQRLYGAPAGHMLNHYGNPYHNHAMY